MNNRRISGLLTGVFLLLAACLARADQAYVEGKFVWLPVVEDFPYNSSFELKQVPNTRPLQFQLVRTGVAEGPVTAASAWFEGSLLIVPEIWIRDVSYWAELREISNGLFRLEDWGKNLQQVIRPQGSYEHQWWERIPGEALDIGVGADGTVWAVGKSERGFDFGLWHWDGRRWYENSGNAIRVDVDPFGRPWVINSENEIYVLDQGWWERIPGAATDIGIGADGSVWALGVSDRRGGYPIYFLGDFGWVRVEGSAVRIDVDPYGAPWVINDDDHIYRLENGRWRRIPGLAKDIGIGADGSVWVIGTDERAGGYSIYQYNGYGWDKIDGSARQISVGPSGEPWVVNRDGDIYRSYGF